MSAIQFVPTVALVLLTALLIDSALARPVPGASDNASGVAAVLEVAGRLERRPTENVDVWIVFTGAKEGFMLGMKARLREHADDLHKDRTWFVNVDTVGNGDPHHVTAEDSGCSSGTTVASSPPASGWARRPTCGGSARTAWFR